MEPQSDCMESYLTPLRRYWHALVQFAGTRHLTLLVGLMLGSAVLEGSGLLVLLPILNALDGGGAAVSLPMVGPFSLPLAGWLALFLLFMAGRGWVIRLRDTRTAALRVGFVEHLRTRFHAAIATAEWRFLSAAPQAELFRLLTMATDGVSHGTYYLLQMVVSLAMAGASLAVAVYLAPVLTLLALAGGSLLWLAQRRRLAKAHRQGLDSVAHDQLFFANASEFFGGLKLIKSAGAEQLQQAQFEREASAASAAQLAFFNNQATGQAFHTLASAALAALLLFYSAQALQLPRADLLLCLLVLARLMPIAGQLSLQLQQIVHMLPSFTALQDWLQRCQQAAEPASAAAQTGAISIAFAHDIQLQNVSYRHEGSALPALDDISLQVPAYRTTALVGTSGAGKTTLGDLLLGLLIPDVGTVLVDGIPLTADHRLAWRQSAGYVPQEAFLFPGSIRSNLLWANPSASDDEIRDALRQAAAADFVARLPQGLDTLVGERGMRLSGGERQRLALARALLRRPRLLVLDEATSHLDNESEREIQHALATLHGQLTLVVIAHRLSTIRHADNIVVMERGKIIESGDWASLSGRAGRFREILDAMPHETPP